MLAIDPEPHNVDFGPNEQWDTSVLRLTHQSLTTPARVLDVDVTTGDIDVVKQTPTPNVDLDAYVAERMWATAPDGKQVPIDVVRRVDTPVDGTRAVLRLRLRLVRGLDAAVVLRGAPVVARPRRHVGARPPTRWWRARARLVPRRQAARQAQHVHRHARRLRPPRRRSASPTATALAIRGGSAGGLLVGACVTIAPEQFKAAVAEVPFVDVVTTMSDPSLPLTVTEWEEWGDPRREPFASYMLELLAVRQHAGRRLSGAATSRPASTTHA